MNPNTLITLPGCPPCQRAREELADHIERGEIRLLSIDELDDQQLVDVANCLIEKEGRVGGPILAEIVDGTVVGCQIGVQGYKKGRGGPDGAADRK